MKKSLLVFALGLAVWSDCAYAAAVHGGVSTALHIAAADGKAVACRRLISAGGDIEARDKNGLTPLLTGCREITSVRALLAVGADATAVDARGNTAITLVLTGTGDGSRSLHWWHLEILKMLLENGVQATPEQKAFIKERAARASYYLKSGYFGEMLAFFADY